MAAYMTACKAGEKGFAGAGAHLATAAPSVAAAAARPRVVTTSELERALICYRGTEEETPGLVRLLEAAAAGAATAAATAAAGGSGVAAPPRDTPRDALQVTGNLLAAELLGEGEATVPAKLRCYTRALDLLARSEAAWRTPVRAGSALAEPTCMWALRRSVVRDAATLAVRYCLSLRSRLPELPRESLRVFATLADAEASGPTIRLLAAWVVGCSVQMSAGVTISNAPASSMNFMPTEAVEWRVRVAMNARVVALAAAARAEAAREEPGSDLANHDLAAIIAECTAFMAGPAVAMAGPGIAMTTGGDGW